MRSGGLTRPQCLQVHIIHPRALAMAEAIASTVVFRMAHRSCKSRRARRTSSKCGLPLLPTASISGAAAIRRALARAGIQPCNELQFAPHRRCHGRPVHAFHRCAMRLCTRYPRPACVLRCHRLTSNPYRAIQRAAGAVHPRRAGGHRTLQYRRYAFHVAIAIALPNGLSSCAVPTYLSFPCLCGRGERATRRPNRPVMGLTDH